MIHQIADDVYAVAKPYPLDGRVSWAPSALGRYQSALCYIINRRTDPVIVDPGLRFMQDDVVAAVERFIRPDASVTILATRPQFECIGNIGAVAGVIRNLRVAGHLQSNYFDCFSPALSSSTSSSGPRVAAISPLDSPLDIVYPELRLLRTIWAYDRTSKVLFVSDSFSHGHTENAGDPPIVTDEAGVVIDLANVRSNLYATNHWLSSAKADAIADDVARIFDMFDVETIAPVRGCVLQGRTVVERHVSALLDVLRNAKNEPFVAAGYLTPQPESNDGLVVDAS